MRRSNIYTRRAPELNDKLYYIFCEGDAKETTYFHFFNKITSQIIVQLVPIHDGKNSPMGLYNNACRSLINSDDNQAGYNFNKGDEVWFVIDTGDWGAEISALRDNVAKHENWFIAQSNKCFEVWLYYHFFDNKPDAPVENWKEHLNNVVKGGFNNRKHPRYLERAISAALKNIGWTGIKPDEHTTEVYRLGERILPLVKKDIDLLLP